MASGKQVLLYSFVVVLRLVSSVRQDHSLALEAAADATADSQQYGRYGDPKSDAKKVAVRACLNRMADDYDTFVRSPAFLGRVDFKIPLEWDIPSFVGDVMEYSALADQVTMVSWGAQFAWQFYGGELDEETSALQGRRKELKRNLTTWGFDADKAEKECRTRIDAAEKSSTDTRNCWDECINEACLDISQDMIDEGMEQAIELRRAKAMYKWRAKLYQKKQESTERTKKLMALLAENEIDLKDFDKLVKCFLVEADAEEFSMTAVVERIDREVNMPAMINETQGCMENVTYGFCAEGMRARWGRAPNPKRQKKWTAAAFFAAGPVSFVTGALIGAVYGIPGGPPGMLAGAATGAAMGELSHGGLLLVPVAAVAGAQDIFQTCRCWQDECSWDAQAEVCTLAGTDASPSSNPYKWLPYPGQKCGMSEGACQMQPCDIADMKPETKVHGLFGTVGRRGADLLNCLSTSESGMQRMIDQLTLPGGFGENAPEHRNQIYDKLGAIESE